jgi:hypothetical protein
VDVSENLQRGFRVSGDLAVVKVDVVQLLQDQRIADPGTGQNPCEEETQLLELGCQFVSRWVVEIKEQFGKAVNY